MVYTWTSVCFSQPTLQSHPSACQRAIMSTYRIIWKKCSLSYHGYTTWAKNNRPGPSPVIPACLFYVFCSSLLPRVHMNYTMTTILLYCEPVSPTLSGMKWWIKRNYTPAQTKQRKKWLLISQREIFTVCSKVHLSDVTLKDSLFALQKDGNCNPTKWLASGARG